MKSKYDRSEGSFLWRLAEEKLCILIGKGSFNDPRYQDIRNKVNSEPINPMDREGRFRRMGEELLATKVSSVLKEELIEEVIFNGSPYIKKIHLKTSRKATVEVDMEI